MYVRDEVHVCAAAWGVNWGVSGMFTGAVCRDGAVWYCECALSRAVVACGTAQASPAGTAQSYEVDRELISAHYTLGNLLLFPTPGSA